MLSEKLRERIIGWDRRLSAAARKVRILSPLKWPPEVEEAFLDAWDRGERVLPAPPPVAVDYHRPIEALTALIEDIDDAEPLGGFLRRTAESYLAAARMISSAGKEPFTRHSIALYGTPRGIIADGAPSHLEAAEAFLSQSPVLPPEAMAITEPDMSAEQAQAWMQERINQFFDKEHLPVEIHDDLAALASAGARRVRLRGQTHYA
ncbi:MAG: tyrosine/phenylalanine carboxypeptidase domain-containing protein, partial [Myxococcota bacterium]